MKKNNKKPEILFEVSWEVCNKVGGIYTVLSTKAKTLYKVLKDNLIFIGPDLWKNKTNKLFKEDKHLFKEWTDSLQKDKLLSVRVGRWNIPSNPIVILVDFTPFYEFKNDIYAFMWEHFGVDSIREYGDYNESSMFSYAAGKVAKSFYEFNKLDGKDVVYQAHEWMTGMGALYLKVAKPEIATIFTTHATSVGRSIASNYKPLYDYLPGYFGDQMANELNVQAKHSVEKAIAHNADCFTTVSQITALEAEQLLDKKVDVVLPNGFENDFVPKGGQFTSARNTARKKLIEIAQKILGIAFNDDTLIVGTSGRYELKNKGLDVFIDAMNDLSKTNSCLDKDILAFIFVPGWVGEARQDLLYRLKQNGDKQETTSLEFPYITHWLHQMESDQIVSMMRDRGMKNAKENKVKLIFVPCYLDGKDGVFNMEYYDLLIGQDLTIYPSYYEPWGYTPLESIAFKIPTVTTNLSGFGRWVEGMDYFNRGITDGVEVLKRTDQNYSEMVENVAKVVCDYSTLNKKEINRIRNRACQLSEKALWSNFITSYYDAYAVALRNKDIRVKEQSKS
ncbi:Glycogen(starch) synthase [Bacteroides coprosuis DSM 18011]|uniref:Glycogen(Starch) synthase n=1 Tax=Bacteroides coprosuis DSM 18011 TaxID=679937 RepID=F3ZTZ2_9BACE|nr:glycosyltransferase [Bacteroides coprosuis]EGJ71093.1 Glycogen(starch) synthase [Bacteroides coprosuis DSM 18011]HJD93152.1 glycogen/starch synthase [Bacteroides coprosuis]